MFLYIVVTKTVNTIQKTRFYVIYHEYYNKRLYFIFRVNWNRKQHKVLIFGEWALYGIKPAPTKPSVRRYWWPSVNSVNVDT